LPPVSRLSLSARAADRPVIETRVSRPGEFAGLDSPSGGGEPFPVVLQPGEEVVGLDHVDLGCAGSVERFLKALDLVRECGYACVERIGRPFGSRSTGLP